MIRCQVTSVATVRNAAARTTNNVLPLSVTFAFDFDHPYYAFLVLFARLEVMSGKHILMQMAFTVLTEARAFHPPNHHTTYWMGLGARSDIAESTLPLILWQV